MTRATLVWPAVHARVYCGRAQRLCVLSLALYTASLCPWRWIRKTAAPNSAALIAMSWYAFTRGSDRSSAFVSVALAVENHELRGGGRADGEERGGQADV